MRHPSRIKLVRNSPTGRWRPATNGQYHEANAWIKAGLVRFSNLNTNEPRANAKQLPLPSVRVPSPPRRRSPSRQRPAHTGVSRRNATSLNIGLYTGMRHPTILKMVRNSPTQKWRPAANQYSEAAGYLRNNMVNFKNLNTNDPKAAVKKGPSVANVRRWLNTVNVQPNAWYNHVSEWGYNTKKWAAPARNAFSKYQKTRNSENLVRIMSRSLKNLKANNARNNRNREIRRMLTANLKKVLSQFT